jgi:hypothetical protein
VNPFELTFGVLTVLVLLGLAAYFSWRQIQTLGRVRRQSDLSTEDRSYFRSQARRRLLGSALMVLLAGVLIGSYFLDQEYRQLTEQAEQRPDRSAPIGPEEKEFLQRYTIYWVIALVVVFLFGLFAVLDVLATLRYGASQHRQLRDQHRAQLEQEVRRFRQERNGDTDYS